MKMDQFSRTRLLLGDDAVERLKNCRVAVFGIGGVGSFAAEALIRSGLGTIDLIDDDKVCLTNLNRQLIALRSTVGQYKTEVMRNRILDINPQAVVHEHRCFFLPENKKDFPFQSYDYIIDAVDTVSAKLALIEEATENRIPILSSMGAGNKINPAMLEVADIQKTSVCPLARVIRKELKKRGIEHLKCVYSREKPLRPLEDPAAGCRNHCICPPGTRKCTVRRDIPGSVSFVPSVAGLIAAGEVIKDLTGIRNDIRVV